MALVTVMGYSSVVERDVECFHVRCDLTGREAPAARTHHPGGPGYSEAREEAIGRAVAYARSAGFRPCYLQGRMTVEYAVEQRDGQIAGVRSSYFTWRGAPAMWVHDGSASSRVHKVSRHRKTLWRRNAFALDCGRQGVFRGGRNG